ncbi:MAG TPA: thiamine biosynthesis protein ThiS [Deltaproteobacteria bacterium]|nr:thiamine biosynthesis protein ThiS [Deltaproteobacteria bacterium]
MDFRFSRPYKTQVISIRLNGEWQKISETTHLAQLISELRVDIQKVAVAKNLEVVLRSELGNTRMQDGDEIEIFHAVGGG